MKAIGLGLLIAATAAAAVADASPIGAAAIDPARHAELVRAIAASRGATPPAQLAKADIRATMKLVGPLIAPCYARAQAKDPHIVGVVNLELAFDSAAALGSVVTLRGFDATGALGRSAEFRACVADVIGALVLPPAPSGTLAFDYPFTFAPVPPDNADTQLADRAHRAADAGHWRDALDLAERALASTSIDGTVRRPLISLAGVAACRIADAAKARHFFALASPGFEDAIKGACAQAGIPL